MEHLACHVLHIDVHVRLVKPGQAVLMRSCEPNSRKTQGSIGQKSKDEAAFYSITHRDTDLHLESKLDRTGSDSILLFPSQ